MVVIGVFQGRRVVLNTASVLAMDDARRFLSWESTFRSGRISIQGIENIDRAQSRPSVYMIRSSDGSAVPFWLSKRNIQVQSFFAELKHSNPQVVLDDLYGRYGISWRGLPAPHEER